jgi:hypothetical protein
MDDRLQPAFWGGLFIGVLSALPFVNLGNCCCCLWVLSGGVLAAYLRQQNSPVQIDVAEGAIVGLLAGLIGGVISAVLSIPMQMMVGPMQEQFIQRLLSNNPDLPPEARDAIERFAAGSALRVAGMFIGIVVDVIFGMFGGLLGVAIFKKKTPPPPPPGTVEVLPPESHV